MTKKEFTFKVHDNYLEPVGEDWIVYLLRSNWDDFGYKTSFSVMIFSKGRYETIGTIKIGTSNSNRLNENGSICIPKEFPYLHSEFFSLGQDIEFYMNFSKKIGLNKLSSLNDIILDDRYKPLYQEKSEIFISSLNRFFSYTTFEQVKRFLEHKEIYISYGLNFNFKKNKMNFDVVKSRVLPTNLHAIIGANGVGKTRLLDSIVKEYAPSLYQEIESEISHTNIEEGNFSRLIYISTSIFSKLYKVSEEIEFDNNYHYIGFNSVTLVDGSKVKAASTREDILEDIFKTVIACNDLGRIYYLKIFVENFSFDRNLSTFLEDILSYLDDLEFMNEDIRQQKDNELKDNLNKLSSGHAVVIYMIFKLIHLVEEKAIVLIDEPETHLHPPLLSAFIMSVNDVLRQKNALGILATHSPVVLQEIPSECVWKIYENKIERPTINTFGENVGIITRDVFQLELDKSGFAKFIRTLDNSCLPRIEESLGSEALFEYYLRDDIDDD